MKGFWLAGVGFLVCGMAWAQDCPVEVSVEQQAVDYVDKITPANHPMAPGIPGGATGQKVDRSISFTAILHNKGMDDLANVGIKIYLMEGPNAQNTDNTRLHLHVAKVFSQDNIPILSAQDAKVTLGDSDFTAQTTTTTQIQQYNTSTGIGQQVVVSTHYAGDIFQGYVTEIYIDDKLADVRIGNGSMKDAYEKYLAQARKATDAANPAPTN